MNLEIPDTDFGNYKDISEPTQYPLSVAWAGVLDCRYGIEVKRVEPYKGKLCIYDLENNKKLIHSRDTSISFDAKFGPDGNDVEMWQDIGVEVVDKKE